MSIIIMTELKMAKMLATNQIKHVIGFQNLLSLSKTHGFFAPRRLFLLQLLTPPTFLFYHSVTAELFFFFFYPQQQQQTQKHTSSIFISEHHLNKHARHHPHRSTRSPGPLRTHRPRTHSPW